MSSVEVGRLVAVGVNGGQHAATLAAGRLGHGEQPRPLALSPQALVEPEVLNVHATGPGPAVQAALDLAIVAPHEDGQLSPIVVASGRRVELVQALREG